MSEDPTHTASPLYAIGRLERALAAAAEHPDPRVRARAVKRGEQWRAVLSGMSDGTLTVGSRTPVADTPAWVTLEVVHGGFATGRYVAEGPLAEFEEELAALVEGGGETPRARVNAWYLGDEGQAALVAAIREGRVTVALPEDGALPVVAWLLAVGQPAEGLDLVATLRPLMHRLRFYPKLEATPRPSGSVVRVTSNAEVAKGLRSAPERPQISAMNEALRVWNPLYDRLVALWLETVDGDVPYRRDGKHGVSYAGGRPGQRWPDGWMGRRDAWLADYRRAAVEHPRCRKHASPDSNFYRLRVVLEGCDGTKLSFADETRARHALAHTVTRRGAPGSEEREGLRAVQAVVAARPSNVELAEVLARRIDAYPAQGGLPGLDPVAAPIAEGEYAGVAGGTEIPAHMIFKASRALEAPIGELVERQIIGSAEVLAIVLPQITSQVAAAGIEDPGLRDLYGQIYAAFRRRRSLLLLNLEHQVRFEELPWIAALAPLRKDGLDTRAQARQTLEEVTVLAFTGFPETILPNPLVREMTALAQRASLEIPFVEEVAADIFMGTFTVKWAEAALQASRLLADTVYAHYYDLPGSDFAAYAVDRKAPKVRWSKPTADGFVKLCNTRAREAGTVGGSWVAKNGAIIEQSMVLTSHNLAALVSGLGLGDRVRVLAPTLAARAFKFAVRRQAQCPPDFKSRLQAVKNAAYAWRQGIFFLSFCAPEVQWRVVDELAAEVAKASDRGWAERFAPAVVGLRHILGGGRFDEDGHGKGPELPVRFLGWSVGKHWVFA